MMDEETGKKKRIEKGKEACEDYFWCQELWITKNESPTEWSNGAAGQHPKCTSRPQAQGNHMII